MNKTILLKNLANYVEDKISADKLNKNNYIGVDNILPNRGGIKTSEYFYGKGKVTAFKKSDILIGNIRPYFKKIWLATFDGGCDTDVLCIRPKKEELSSFLYSTLSTDFFFNYVVKGAKGSKMPRGDKKHIMEFPIMDISNKKVIGDFIVAINEKIANNNAISKELESIAKTIYDYWFLQFDFPDKDGKPYKSNGGKMVWNDQLKQEIPEGWEVKDIFECADVQYGKPLSTKLFSEKGTPVIRIRDINTLTNSAYTKENVEDKYLSKTGDLLIGMDGNFQMNFWPRNDDCVNQRIVRIRKKSFPSLLTKFQIKPYIDQKVSSVARSTVGHLKANDIEELKILVPNVDQLDVSIFNVFLDKIITLNNENEQLQSLRDFLLPMLMNGQVIIED